MVVVGVVKAVCLVCVVGVLCVVGVECVGGLCVAGDCGVMPETGKYQSCLCRTVDNGSTSIHQQRLHVCFLQV